MKRQKIDDRYYVTVVPSVHHQGYDARVHSDGIGIVASENGYRTEGEAMRAGVREGQRIAGYGTVSGRNRSGHGHADGFLRVVKDYGNGFRDVEIAYNGNRYAVLLTPFGQATSVREFASLRPVQSHIVRSHVKQIARAHASSNRAGRSGSRHGAFRAPKTMIVENVQYHRYKIRFRWSDGRVVQWIRYAPAEIYMRESFERELAAKDITPDLLMPGSATIRRA